MDKKPVFLIFIFGVLCGALLFWILAKSGGKKVTYRVTAEVNFEDYLETKAYFVDQVLYELIAAAEREAELSGLDFYDALRRKFETDGRSFTDYFATNTLDDAAFVDLLKKETGEAVQRTIKIVAERAREYDLPMDYITRESEYWFTAVFDRKPTIPLEHIFETTGKLSFHLVCDAAITAQLLEQIDNTLKGSESIGYTFDGDLHRREASDTTAVDIDELFEDYRKDHGLGQGTATARYPLLSRLRILSGDRRIYAPAAHVAAVDSLFRCTAVRMQLPVDILFMWCRRTVIFDETPHSQLYCLFGAERLRSAHVIHASPVKLENNSSGLAITLNDAGIALLDELTAHNIGKYLAIAIDNKVFTAPKIQARIGTGRVLIDGLAGEEEAEMFASILRTGSLAAPLRIGELKRVKN